MKQRMKKVSYLLGKVQKLNHINNTPL
uniref:Uncharacterized protein n=1 Tax=Arundo donax TaxID=35708 RepID=A0A0A9ES00_ARUDO